jgi:hypothetical protein
MKKGRERMMTVDRKDRTAGFLILTIICIFCIAGGILLHKGLHPLTKLLKTDEQTSCTIFTYTDEKGAYYIAGGTASPAGRPAP